MGKLEKVNGRYADLRVDPLFSQDSVLISTYFVNNHGSFGQPLIGVAYEGVNRYRLKNGLSIKHTYYPRNKKRIETSELNHLTEINNLCKAMGTPDVVNNDHAARTYIGFDGVGFPTKATQNYYYQYQLNFTLTYKVYITFTTLNIDNYRLNQ